MSKKDKKAPERRRKVPKESNDNYIRKWYVPKKKKK